MTGFASSRAKVLEKEYRRDVFMSSRLSAEECRRAMEGLAPQIERYAELLVHKGAAIKPGQELVL